MTASRLSELNDSHSLLYQEVVIHLYVKVSTIPEYKWYYLYFLIMLPIVITSVVIKVISLILIEPLSVVMIVIPGR